ncbi:MAG: class I SAM-dependent methyltransferase [Caldisericaceae bacterium]|nr:class I SAM-dependent methyltransferase [Caldisericaceae bacterium]
MPYEFHQDRVKYFQIQTEVTQHFILPFIKEKHQLPETGTVLEIGCGEAGVLKAFTELGWQAVGVDLAQEKLQLASQLMATEVEQGQLRLINKNIYEESFKKEFAGQFDLIILKDVIEHIPQQSKLLSYLHTFLKQDGVIFFAFPPWLMPFGGHQQMCQSFLKKVPYFHLLPRPLYRWILKLGGEPPSKIEGLLANKRTGITIERFERILKKTGYQILHRRLYLFNPIYRYKFGLKPREQFAWLGFLPYLRDFFTTGVYYLVKKI